MVKGFGFIEKKLNHFERIIPGIIIKEVSEKVATMVESKLKSYTNNIMTTTIEATIRKQFSVIPPPPVPPPVPVPLQAGTEIIPFCENLYPKSKLYVLCLNLVQECTEKSKKPKALQFEDVEQVRRLDNDLKVWLKSLWSYVL